VNLADVRSFVRSQLDLPEEDDLPTTLLDSYIREGFNRTIQRERHWPFYETSWTETVVADATSFTLSDDVAGIASVKVATDNYRLRHIAHDLAEESFRGTITSGVPAWFSLWGGELYVWPSTNGETVLTVRGWRKPTDWMANPATEIDADERLHLPVVHYACSLAYAQQEDDLLESMYLRRWDQGVVDAHRDIMRPQHDRPLVFAGGLRVPYARGGVSLDI
jgi:hypothetical protein